LPLLYKEFVLDPWQLWHARSCGASAVLLILAVLDDARLRDLMAEAAAAGLECLLEVHDEEELRRAVATGGRCIGVNNRDLRTFTVSLDTTCRLLQQAPADSLVVSESGIRTGDDIRQLREAGAGAVLVGETLLRRADPGEAVRELMGAVWASS